MEELKALIDINKVFSCVYCKKIAFDPSVTICCEVITCQACIVPNVLCKGCMNPAKFKKSLILQRIYQNIFSQCSYGCKTTLPLSQNLKHMDICPEATTLCPFCKNVPKIRLMPQHIGEFHPQECSRLLLQFQRKKQIDNKVESVPEIIQRIQPFKYGTTGNINVDPRLSISGRLVCGRPLPQLQLAGYQMLNSSGLFQRNKENCSAQQGSCDRCMELDVDRLGLPKNYLLNFQGRICIFIMPKRKVACGCSHGNKVCNQQLQCAPCRRTLDLVERGFYKKCLA